jgi:hypothetical protein
MMFTVDILSEGVELSAIAISVARKLLFLVDGAGRRIPLFSTVGQSIVNNGCEQRQGLCPPIQRQPVEARRSPVEAHLLHDATDAALDADRVWALVGHVHL